MKRISLRIDDDLHQRLKDAARSSRRSLQCDIVLRLERDLDEYNPLPSRRLTNAEQIELMARGISKKYLKGTLLDQG